MTAATTGPASVMTEVELSIRGMTCASCAARVEKKLSGLDGVVANSIRLRRFGTTRRAGREPRDKEARSCRG